MGKIKQDDLNRLRESGQLYKYKYSLSTNYLIRKVRMERHHLLHLEIILLHLPIKQFLLL